MATVALDRAGTRLVAETTTDRELIRAFLNRDRIYAAYALADLEDRDTGRARWGVARQDDEVVALVLEYGGPSPQPLFIAGSDDGIDAILREVIRPSIAYVACLPANLAGVERRYRLEPGPQMVRMWVDRNTFRQAEDPGIERLGAIDTGELNRLYRLGFEFRGRGYAQATTGAVTAHLLEFCDHVVLNVRSDNPPALNAYRRLGYAEHVRFEERLGHRVGSLLADIASALRRFARTRESQRR
jgi:hypothetical protein